MSPILASAQTPVPQTSVPQAPAPQTPAPQTPVPVAPIPMPPVPMPPVPKIAVAVAPDDKASDFVHCDGKPNTESSLSVAARLVAISLVVGLFIPMPETPDATKRRQGEAGIKACDAALNGKEKASDGGRRLELILGRVIHRMEIADWQGAIDDTATLKKDQPELTSTRAYRQSLAQTASYLEGISLVGKGDYDAAVAKGYAIANESPYNPYTLQLSVDLVVLEDGYTPQKKQLLDQDVRLAPREILNRAIVRAIAGDLAGAGDDYAAYGDLMATVPNVETYMFQGLAATGYRLAGDSQKADALFATAQQAVDADIADDKNKNQVKVYKEIGDFNAIITALDKGQGLRARNMFSAHSDWRVINNGYVAALSRRLQSVGTPEEQAESPIRSPEQIAADFRKVNISRILSKGEKGDKYWKYFLPANSDAAYNKIAISVWKTKKSPYAAKERNKEINAQWISTSANGVGVPCAYAIYMHLALLAKAQGKTGFMIMPGQDRLCETYFRIGNPDDKDMVAPFVMNADQVIADLGTYFPNQEN